MKAEPKPLKLWKPSELMGTHWNAETRRNVYDAFMKPNSKKKKQELKKWASSVVADHFKIGDAVSVGPFGSTYNGPLYGIIIGFDGEFVDVGWAFKLKPPAECGVLRVQAWDLRKMKEVNE